MSILRINSLSFHTNNVTYISKFLSPITLPLSVQHLQENYMHYIANSGRYFRVILDDWPIF
uniref:Uncharacterized protein n=1 Tax=Rhizophora mucronata TaxID=61149 RepID=A0A2P2NP97_RHIMU